MIICIYDLDNLIGINDTTPENIEIDKKLYQDIVTYYIRFEILKVRKPLYIDFQKK